MRWLLLSCLCWHVLANGSARFAPDDRVLSRSANSAGASSGSEQLLAGGGPSSTSDALNPGGDPHPTNTFSGEGLWSDTLKWSLGRVPGRNDTVVIPVGARVGLNIDSTIRGLTLSGSIGNAGQTLTVGVSMDCLSADSEFVGFGRLVLDSGGTVSDSGVWRPFLLAGRCGTVSWDVTVESVLRLDAVSFAAAVAPFALHCKGNVTVSTATSDLIAANVTFDGAVTIALGTELRLRAAAVRSRIDGFGNLYLDAAALELGSAAALVTVAVNRLTVFSSAAPGLVNTILGSGRGCRMSVARLDIPFRLQLDGSGTLALTRSWQRRALLMVSHDWTVVVPAEHTLVAYGPLRVYPPAIGPAGVFEIRGTLLLVNGTQEEHHIRDVGVWNYGNLTVQGPGLILECPITNAGLVDVGARTLFAAGAVLTQIASGVLHVRHNATLSSAESLRVEAGLVTGAGTIVGPSHSETLTIEAGATIGAAPATTLALTGILILRGTLAVTITHAQAQMPEQPVGVVASLLTVTEGAYLDTGSVAILGPALPPIGDSLVVLASADFLSGNLQSVVQSPGLTFFNVLKEDQPQQVVVIRMPDHANRTVVRVGPGGQDQPSCVFCRTLQYVLNSDPGVTTILLVDGLFSGPGNVNVTLPFRAPAQGSLLIKAEDGGKDPAAVEFNCGYVGRAFDLFHSETSSVVFEGFTIAGCDTGVQLRGSSPTFRNVVFRNNLAAAPQGGYGGAVRVLEASSPTFDRCRFQSNLGLMGAAIYAADRGSVLTLRACSFVGNAAQASGGAILATQFARVLDYGSRYEFNNAFEIGGAVLIDSAEQSLFEGSVFSHNFVSGTQISDARGGGLYVSQCTVNLLDAQFLSNEARGGGAIALDNGGVLMANGTHFAGNVASRDSSAGGGAIWLAHSSSSLFDDCTFVNNTAQNVLSGGGCFFATTSSSIMAVNCDFRSNSVGEFSLGGGVAFLQGGGACTFDHCHLAYNLAPDGGCVMGTEMVEVTFIGGRVENNYAVKGNGGVASIKYSSRFTAVQGVEFFTNYALGMGGALHVGTGVETAVTDATFYGNSAQQLGAAFAHDGLANPEFDRQCSFARLRFDQNSAQGSGAAVSLANNDACSFVDSEFNGNQAAETGGCITFGGRQPPSDLDKQLAGSSFTGNTAYEGGGALFFTAAAACPDRKPTTSHYASNWARVSGVPVRNDFSSGPYDLSLFTVNGGGNTSTGFMPGVPVDARIEIRDCFGQLADWSRVPIALSLDNAPPPPASQPLHSPAAAADPSQSVAAGCQCLCSTARVVVESGTARFPLSFERPANGSRCLVKVQPDDATLIYLSPVPFSFRVLDCLSGYYQVATRRSCAACAPGTYSLLTNADRCHECPEGASCPDARTVVSQDGFWTFFRNSDPSTGIVETHACPPGWCLANNTCAPNRELPYSQNVLCGQCQAGHSLVFGNCVDCPSANGGAVLLLIVGLGGYVVLIHLTVQDSSATTGILLYFVQTYVLLLEPYQPVVARLIAGAFGLGGGSSPLVDACLGPMTFYDRVALRLSLLPIALSLLALLALLHTLLGRCCAGGGAGGGAEKRFPPFELHRYQRTTLAVVISSFSTVLQCAFDTFACVDVGGWRVVASSPATSCSSATHTSWVAFMAVLLSAMLLVSLVLVPWRLLQARRAGRMDSPAYARVWGLLWENYHVAGSPSRWDLLGEAFFMLRRVVLVAVYSFLIDRSQPRTVSLLLCNSAFLLVHLYVRPFARQSDHVLEALSLLLLSVLYRPSDSDFLQVWVSTVVVVSFAALIAHKIARKLHRPLAFPALRSLQTAGKPADSRLSVVANSDSSRSGGEGDQEYLVLPQ